jgi:hypothetical protein
MQLFCHVPESSLCLLIVILFNTAVSATWIMQRRWGWLVNNVLGLKRAVVHLSVTILEFAWMDFVKPQSFYRIAWSCFIFI